jgi:F-type H+-transporting ATPase subunit b
MGLFTSLGLDATMFIQMGVFLVVFVVLKKVLFEAYFAAAHEREERTVGQAEAAERYINEAQELEEKFSSKAQEINDQFKTIYDRSREEATKEYDRLIQDARTKAKDWIENARGKVDKEIKAAHSQMTPDVPLVSQMITAKLLGKEVSQ